MSNVYFAATFVLCLTLLQAQHARCEVAPDAPCEDDTVQTPCHPAWDHTVAVRIDPKTIVFKNFLFDEDGYIVSFTYAPDEVRPEKCIVRNRPSASWIVRHRSELADVLEYKLLSYIRNSWDVHTRYAVAALLLIEDPYEAYVYIRENVGASATMFLRRSHIDVRKSPRVPAFILAEADSPPALTTAGYYAWMELLHRIADNRSELAHALYDYPAEGFLEAA